MNRVGLVCFCLAVCAVFVQAETWEKWIEKREIAEERREVRLARGMAERAEAVRSLELKDKEEEEKERRAIEQEMEREMEKRVAEKRRNIQLAKAMAKRAEERRVERELTKRAEEKKRNIELAKAMDKRAEERRIERELTKRAEEKKRNIQLRWPAMAKRAEQKRAILRAAMRKRAMERAELELEKRAADLGRSFVAAHDKARYGEKAALSGVTWNAELAQLAQDQADQCILEHDDPTSSQFESVGQNLYWSSEPSDSKSASAWAEEAVKDWMKEKKDYDYDTNQCSSTCGHYTQVVWKSSTSIGCAISQGCQDGTYVTCNYGPAGNYEGEKPY